MARIGSGRGVAAAGRLLGDRPLLGAGRVEPGGVDARASPSSSGRNVATALRRAVADRPQLVDAVVLRHRHVVGRAARRRPRRPSARSSAPASSPSASAIVDGVGGVDDGGDLVVARRRSTATTTSTPTTIATTAAAAAPTATNRRRRRGRRSARPARPATAPARPGRRRGQLRRVGDRRRACSARSAGGGRRRDGVGEQRRRGLAQLVQLGLQVGSACAARPPAPFARRRSARRRRARASSSRSSSSVTTAPPIRPQADQAVADARLHRAEGDAQVIGDLDVGQPVVERQLERLALRRRQRRPSPRAPGCGPRRRSASSSGVALGSSSDGGADRVWRSRCACSLRTRSTARRWAIVTAHVRTLPRLASKRAACFQISTKTSWVTSSACDGSRRTRRTTPKTRRREHVVERRERRLIARRRPWRCTSSDPGPRVHQCGR